MSDWIDHLCGVLLWAFLLGVCAGCAVAAALS